MTWRSGAWAHGAAAAAIAASLWSAFSPAARAQGPSLQEAREQLDSSSPREVRGALESLGLLGDRRAVEPIAARIRRGLPPELLAIAIDTLTILGRSEAGPVLIDLARHRRAEVRLAAIRGLAATSPPGAEAVVSAALGDGDPAVRGAAAQALAELGATDAVDRLFEAMERRVPEAPMAIAALAGPDDVERFLGYLGRIGFGAITPALGEMLHRSDLSASAKQAIVRRVAELATPEARQFLEDFVATADPSPARQAAEAAIGSMGS